MLAFTVISALLYWTGKWFGGIGSFFSLRCAVSWANVTSIATVALGLLIAFAFKEIAFCNNFMQMSISSVWIKVLVGIFAMQLIISVWTICLLVNAVAQVQGFSIGKALMNIIAAILVAFVFLWAVSFLIGAMQGIYS
jgi:hypothetical protein